MPSNHLFEPGDVFDVYSIQEPFEGRDRPIQCFLATDTRSNRQVKLHCLDRRPRENTPEQIERFHSTLARLRALDHTTLAATYDGGVTDRVYWAATEHAIDGITLGSLLGDPKRRFAGSLCFLFTSQLASALRVARDAGILHLRLHPDRILIHPSFLGVDKLLDVGLAELFSLSPAVMRSDPLYRAPEQLRDKGRAPDERTDIYALGMILYAMLAWDPPFADKDGELPGRDKLIFLAMTQTPPLLGEGSTTVPEFLDVFLQSVFAKSRANRPPSWETFGAQLNEVFERYSVWCGAMNEMGQLEPAKARALMTALRGAGDTDGKRPRKPRSGERPSAALRAGIEGYSTDEDDDSSEPEWLAALPPEPEEKDQGTQGPAEPPEVPEAGAAPEASITEEPAQDRVADPAPAVPPPSNATVSDRISPARVTLPSVHLAPPVPEAARPSRLSWAPVAAAAAGVLALAALAVSRSGVFQSPEVRSAEPFVVVLPPLEVPQNLEAPPQPEPSPPPATPSVRLEPRLAPVAHARPPLTEPAKSSAEENEACKTFICLEDGGVKPAQ